MTYYWQDYEREDVQPVRYIQVYERRPPPPSVRRTTLSRVEYYQPAPQPPPQVNYYQEGAEQPRTARILRSNTMRLIKPVTGPIETIRVPIQFKQQITLTPVIQAGQRTYSTARVNLIDSMPVQSMTKTIECKPATILRTNSMARIARSATSANLAAAELKPIKSVIRLAEPIKIVNYHPIPLATQVAVPVKTLYQNPANCLSTYNLQEPPNIEYRNVIQNDDNDVHTYVRDNNNYRQFNKTIVTTVNRNHLHTHRIVTNDNNYDTYVTNNIIRINDIHHNRIEHVPGEKRTFNEYKTIQTIEPPTCQNACEETSNAQEPAEAPNNAISDANNPPKALTYEPDNNYNESPYHSTVNL